MESSSSNDADNFQNHHKKFGVQKTTKKNLINPPLKLLLMTLTKFKEDFSKALEEIGNVEYGHCQLLF